MKELGFSFGNNAALSMYHDGQQREDVKSALRAYITEMQSEFQETISYTGEAMTTEVIGKIMMMIMVMVMVMIMIFIL